MNHRRPFPLVVAMVFLLTAFCLLPTAWGQSTTATLSGTVEDEKGALIPGASVVVINIGTRLERQTTTNGEGYFVVTLLPPSTYKVRVENQGFAPVEVQNVVLNVGDQKSLQVHLKAGNITEMVQITTDAPLVETSPAVGTVVDRQFVENIPLNGRSLQSLIALTPGVVLTKTNLNEAGQFSINGQRANANYFTVDGVSANISSSSDVLIGQSGAGALPGLTSFGGTNNLVSVDALQEFRIQTSTYAPEYGRQPGGQVSLLTRSGTNYFHGAIFDYIRNDVFDANDWFANSRRANRPPLRQNDFGGTFSGPILFPRFGEGGRQPLYDGRNRTFFFFSYEGLRLRQPLFGIVRVPSAEVRQIAPQALQPYLNAFPRPTGPAEANGFAEFAASYSDPTTLNATSIRVDHTLNDRLILFGRYNHAPSRTLQRANARNTLISRSANTQTATTGVTFAFSKHINNDLRVNYSRLTANASAILDTFGGAVVPPDSILFPPGFTRQESLFSFPLSGGLSSALTVGRAVEQVQRQFNFVDNLSIVAGSHQMKMGVDYRRLSPVYAPQKYVQQVSFNGIGITAPGIPPPAGSILSGRAASVSILAQAGPREPVFTNLSLYVQDTWHARRRLILTYGLRWEVNPAPQEKHGNEPFTLVGFDNPATATLGQRGSLYKTTYTNFAPRFGGAYQLSQRSSRETVIRGGIGIFYDLGYGLLANAYTGFPFTSSRLHSNIAYPLGPTDAAPAPISLTPSSATLTAAGPALKLPRVYQFNFAVEQSFGRSQTLTASYVGALGRRLLRREQVLVNAGTNPSFNGTTLFLVTRNAATSDYHAMQLQYQHRLSHGLQALASYTWSHSLDIASRDSGGLPPEGKYDPLQDRGPSDFDVRHALSVAATYDIPKIHASSIGRAVLRGWSIDSIFTARTATPVDVTSSRNFGLGTYSFRPDLVPGVPLYLADPLVPGGRRFNRAAFVIPTALRQGTLGRNALRGFPVWQVDVAIRRQFDITERLKLQLRAESFNVFNHPNFADPIGNVDFPVSLFGVSQSMLGRSLGTGGTNGLNPLYQVGGPRSMQMAVKIIF